MLAMTSPFQRNCINVTKFYLGQDSFTQLSNHQRIYTLVYVKIISKPNKINEQNAQ